MAKNFSAPFLALIIILLTLEFSSHGMIGRPLGIAFAIEFTLAGLLVHHILK